MTLPRLRPDIDDLPAYKAGQRPAPREDIVTYKISSNENPYPPLPGVLDAIIAGGAGHPPLSRPVLARPGRRRSLSGSTCPSRVRSRSAPAAWRSAARSSPLAAGPGDEVLYAWRSFESYPICDAYRGGDERAGAAASRRAPRSRRHGWRRSPTARGSSSSATPNNPTGQVVTQAELVSFLDRVPGDVIVVLDEAYREFIAGDDVADGIELFRRYPNVVVLRTFSKAYGLAALRVGLRRRARAGRGGAPQDRDARSVSPRSPRRRRSPRSTRRTSCSSACGTSSPSASGSGTALRDQGWTVPPHRGELRLAAPRRATRLAFAAACEEAGITVRPFAGRGRAHHGGRDRRRTIGSSRFCGDAPGTSSAERPPPGRRPAAASRATLRWVSSW